MSRFEKELATLENKSNSDQTQNNQDHSQSKDNNNQDQVISQLRSEIKKLKLTNQSLQKDLQLTSRLAESRKNPLPDNNSKHSHLLIYAFLAL